mmetsp:Transcript_31945/g.70203  ORF Transcript_31945/g.70203 Transcript_31945/m.70203 type:complete len:592 (+) Transcript_31945:254-2029(+)
MRSHTSTNSCIPPYVLEIRIVRQSWTAAKMARTTGVVGTVILRRQQQQQRQQQPQASIDIGPPTSRRIRRQKSAERMHTATNSTWGMKVRRVGLAARRFVRRLRVIQAGRGCSRELTYVFSVVSALLIFALSLCFFVAAYGSPYDMYLRGHKILYWGRKPSVGWDKIRPTAKRRSVDEEPIPILIKSINSPGNEHGRPIKQPFEAPHDEDYGGLIFELLEEGGERTILEDSSDSSRRESDDDSSQSDSMDSYYAFDDDHIRHEQCRRVSWHRLHHPNCNVIHEAFMLQAAEFRYLANGFYRDVLSLTGDTGEESIVKTLRLKKHDVDYESMEYVRMDALVMERLTGSPRIVDIYGHCAVTVYTETLPGEIESNAVPHSHMKQSEVDKNFGPQNDWSPELKLSLALGFAEALADLHGFKDGVIVHDDVQLCQFLTDKNGNLKLNDFNRAEIMLYDEGLGEYCKYVNDGAYGNNRAPEEWWKRPLNEQIDTFSFGNAVYMLLTGLEPFYTVDDDKVVHEKMKRGATAYIDDRYRTRSFAESKLVDLIELCFKYDPEERITIFEAVNFLRKALEENEKRKELNIPFGDEQLQKY